MTALRTFSDMKRGSLVFQLARPKPSEQAAARGPAPEAIVLQLHSLAAEVTRQFPNPNAQSCRRSRATVSCACRSPSGPCCVRTITMACASVELPAPMRTVKRCRIHQAVRSNGVSRRPVSPRHAGVCNFRPAIYPPVHEAGPDSCSFGCRVGMQRFFMNCRTQPDASSRTVDYL